MPSNSLAVAAQGLSKIYGSGDAEVRALRQVNVNIPVGEFCAIMGPSGSGKSTLMHLLAGLDKPTAGRVQLGNIEINSLGDKKLSLLRRERIGFVFQSFNLLPMYNAKQNILLPLELGGNKPDPRWFEELVTLLGLADRLTHLPSQLSGGQQQRVAIARALITGPDVVFADEPTGNLDSSSGKQVLAFLRTLVDRIGQTVIMVTHDAVAASYASRVLLLADGLVAGEIMNPTPERVSTSLDALRTQRQ